MHVAMASTLGNPRRGRISSPFCRPNQIVSASSAQRRTPDKSRTASNCSPEYKHIHVLSSKYGVSPSTGQSSHRMPSEIQYLCHARAITILMATVSVRFAMRRRISGNGGKRLHQEPEVLHFQMYPPGGINAFKAACSIPCISPAGNVLGATGFPLPLPFSFAFGAGTGGGLATPLTHPSASGAHHDHDLSS